MKSHRHLFFLFFCTLKINAQNVGINTVNPENSAILDLESFVGTPAQATATISGGTVNTITITNPGSGYTYTPQISISGGGAIVNGGIRATANATVTNGRITAITITNAGSGYTSPPSVIINNNNKGLLLPRLVINNLTNTTTPVVNPADGLLAINTGSVNEKSIYYFDTSRWVDGIKSNNTPKIAYIDITGDTSVLSPPGNSPGFSNYALQSRPTVAPSSSIQGLKIFQVNSTQYDIILPQGEYVFEANVNFSTPASCTSCIAVNPGVSPSNYLMGYFMDLYLDTFNNSTNIITASPTRIRKENPVISTLARDHVSSWVYSISVPVNSNPNIMRAVRVYIGRMSGSTYTDTAIIKGTGSYIKISKIK